MNLSKKQGESKVSKRPAFCLECEQWFEPDGVFSDRCDRCAPPKKDSQVQQTSVEKPEPELPSNVVCLESWRRK